MIRRLRDAHGPDDLAAMYARPHEHTRWQDHILRVAVTVALTRAWAGPIDLAADLSCGDAAILNGLDAKRRILGDYAPGYEHTGPLEDTIRLIPPVDLYVCCETLEHLDSPPDALRAIRGKTRALVLSTPVDAWQDRNPEHYWAWNEEGIRVLLDDAGFQLAIYSTVDTRPAGGEYCFGIWACT